MSYLLDTNVCIALINGNNADVRGNFNQAIKEGRPLWLPSIVTFELWYGAWNSSQIERNLSSLQKFLSGSVRTLPFEAGDAETAGKIRFNLKALGKPIGPYDLLIAAQARFREMPLITHNVREFSRIEGLVIEDWEA